jgi:hypothetical protein
MYMMANHIFCHYRVSNTPQDKDSRGLCRLDAKTNIDRVRDNTVIENLHILLTGPSLNNSSEPTELLLT